jgi:hypothetical protein
LTAQAARGEIIFCIHRAARAAVHARKRRPVVLMYATSSGRPHSDRLAGNKNDFSLMENHKISVDMRLRPVRIKCILKLVSLSDEARRHRVSLLSRSLSRETQQSYRSNDHRSHAIGHQSSCIKDIIVDYIRLLKTTTVGPKARCQLPSMSWRPVAVITNLVLLRRVLPAASRKLRDAHSRNLVVAPLAAAAAGSTQRPVPPRATSARSR